MFRVGAALMIMLKNEYGPTLDMEAAARALAMRKRNVALADIDPADAADALRTELRQFAKAREPFNRRIRDEESVRDWWVAVGQDKDAQIIGVR
jgi:hypothetical protein